MTTLWFFVACVTETADVPAADGGPLDLTVDYPLPTGDGVQLATPDMLVPAYSERLFCYYGTWRNDDAAVNGLTSYQVLPYNHHNQVKMAPDDAPADGTLAECPGGEEMIGYKPFVDGVPPFDMPGGAAYAGNEDGNFMSLAPGYAVKLAAGKRWVIDTHYVNTTGRDILVNSAINLGFTDIDSVTRWVSAVQLDTGQFGIPPGAYSFPFDCAWPMDVEILVVSSHMHGRGTSFTVDYLHDDVTERIHEVQGWSDDYRVYPKMDVWDAGTFMVKAGEIFRTTPSWYNETDETVGFPDEMGTTMVMAAPLEEPLGCYGGDWGEAH